MKERINMKQNIMLEQGRNNKNVQTSKESINVESLLHSKYRKMIEIRGEITEMIHFGHEAIWENKMEEARKKLNNAKATFNKFEKRENDIVSDMKIHEGENKEDKLKKGKFKQFYDSTIKMVTEYLGNTLEQNIRLLSEKIESPEKERKQWENQNTTRIKTQEIDIPQEYEEIFGIKSNLINDIEMGLIAIQDIQNPNEETGIQELLEKTIDSLKKINNFKKKLERIIKKTQNNRTITNDRISTIIDNLTYVKTDSKKIHINAFIGDFLKTVEEKGVTISSEQWEDLLY